MVAAMAVACAPQNQPDQNAGETYVPDGPTKTFHFTVKGNFTDPTFSGAANAPLRAPSTAGYLTADGVEMTDLWVMDYKDGALVQELHQVPTDAEWGVPTMQLTYGTHHILFLASRGTEPVKTGASVVWTKPLDTFYADYEVTVSKTSNGNRAVTLNRCAAKLSVTIDDAIPAGSTSIEFHPATWNNGWNMLTGEPIATSNYVASFVFPQSWVGTTGSTFNSWTLSADDEWTTDVQVLSKTATATNADITIEDVPLKANRVTLYHGTLYGESGQQTLSLNATWLDAYEGVY